MKFYWQTLLALWSLLALASAAWGAAGAVPTVARAAGAVTTTVGILQG
jgi:hypothetical protein